MEPNLLKELGQIAGIGGIAVGVFLLLFRDVIRKKIFPKLTQSQAYRVILVFMILTWSVAIAGVAAWWISNSKAAAPAAEGKLLTIAASIWKVDLDAKGEMVATREFAGATNETILPAVIGELAEWIFAQLGVADRKPLQSVRVKMQIPANLGSQKPRFERIPDGPMEVLLWDLRGGGKLRLPLDWETVKQMEADFQLEVRVPGSAPTLVTVSPGTALDKELELSPGGVGVGVEQFSGLGDGISERLCPELSANVLIKVVDPGLLKTIRDEVTKHNELLRRNPQIQMSIRSLGLDYIISGSVRSEQPAQK